MTPEFRAGLYAVDPAALNVDRLDDAASPAEPEDDRVRSWHASQRCWKTYALGWAMQRAGSRKLAPRVIPLELQRLFAELQLMDVVRAVLGTLHLQLLC